MIFSNFGEGCSRLLAGFFGPAGDRTFHWSGLIICTLILMAVANWAGKAIRK